MAIFELTKTYRNGKSVFYIELGRGVTPSDEMLEAIDSVEDAKASAKEFLRQRTIARYGTENVMSGGGDWHIDIRDMAKFAEQYAAKRLESYRAEIERKAVEKSLAAVWKICRDADKFNLMTVSDALLAVKERYGKQ